MPTIQKVPNFQTKDELIAFLNSDNIRELRPQAKVVHIIKSRNTETIHEGTMFRKRMSKKKNVYKQVIKPHNQYLPPLFLLENQKIVETKHRDVKFKIIGWKEKWPIARLESE